MVINWLVALKAVPWGDLVQAAPHLVKSARSLFNTARSTETPHAADASVPVRIGRIEQALDSLNAEQRSSAELIRSLAEQNAAMVAALEVLRARTRWIFGICAALVAAVVLLAITRWH